MTRRVESSTFQFPQRNPAIPGSVYSADGRLIARSVTYNVTHSNTKENLPGRRPMSMPPCSSPAKCFRWVWVRPSQSQKYIYLPTSYIYTYIYIYICIYIYIYMPGGGRQDKI